MGNDQDVLDLISHWLERDELEQSRMGPMFVKLFRILTEAELPEIWNPAINMTHYFLEIVERDLVRDLQWTHAESAKVFSMLLTILADAGQYRHETFSADPERRKLIDEELLPQMGQLREHAVSVAKQYLHQPVFSSL